MMRIVSNIKQRKNWGKFFCISISAGWNPPSAPSAAYNIICLNLNLEIIKLPSANRYWAMKHCENEWVVFGKICFIRGYHFLSFILSPECKERKRQNIQYVNMLLKDSENFPSHHPSRHDPQIEYWNILLICCTLLCCPLPRRDEK